jgi:putative two-component system response regulator
VTTPAPVSPHGAGNVMVVDDNPANLNLLENMLRQYGYVVRSFPRGRLAIAAAQQHPPDLVLLDINMPEMDGFEVCERLKGDARLARVPVIFLSALNAVEDKIKGLQTGGVDYISKPFHFEEVRARVETHLRLQRAQQAERDLLEKTLGGVVATLWELIQVSSPVLALRSRAVRDIVQCITERTGSSDAWQYDLAARLCLIGCLSLPEDIFRKAWRGAPLTPDEDQMFNAHPRRGASLLANIPRLDIVAEIIGGQNQPEAVAPTSEQVKTGAPMLHLALQLDRRLHCGVAPAAALAELSKSGRFDPRWIDALKGYSPAQLESELRRLPIRELRAGMTLESDLYSPDGKLLILRAGTLLNDTWIERIGNFAKGRGQELIQVRVPK